MLKTKTETTVTLESLGPIGYISVWTIILNFHQATHLSLIKNESYQESPEKTKNNGEHERRY